MTLERSPLALALVVLAACGGGGSPPADGGGEGDGASADGDVADSHAPDGDSRHTLTIVFEGDGRGSVTSEDAFTCDTDCAQVVDAGVTLRLVAVPFTSDHLFDGWSGACSGGGETCDVTLDEDRMVTLRFSPKRNYAFTTSARVLPGTLGSAEQADALCNMAAANGDPRLTAHGQHYAAFLSTPDSPALGRNVLGSGWVRLDGAPFVVSRDALVGGNAYPLYPPRLDENGEDLALVPDDATGGGRYIITGIEQDGSVGAACAGLTDAAARFDAAMIDATIDDWTEWANVGCTTTARLLCLGTDYATPVAPPTPPRPDDTSVRRVFQHEIPPALVLAGRDSLDALCQSAADAADLDIVAVALVGTETETPAQRLSADGGPWVRPDGVIAVGDPETFLTTGIADAPLGGVSLARTLLRNFVIVGARFLETAPLGSSCQGYTSRDAGSAYRSTFGHYSLPEEFGRGIFSCASIPQVICIEP